jgi:hypothetical protein
MKHIISIAEKYDDVAETLTTLIIGMTCIGLAPLTVMLSL